MSTLRCPRCMNPVPDTVDLGRKDGLVVSKVQRAPVGLFCCDVCLRPFVIDVDGVHEATELDLRGLTEEQLERLAGYMREGERSFRHE